MNENLIAMLNFILGCRHRKLSRPFACSRRTYKLCLDCGRQFPCLLETMALQRIGPPQDAANASSRYRIEQAPAIAIGSDGISGFPGTAGLPHQKPAA